MDINNFLGKYLTKEESAFLLLLRDKGNSRTYQIYPEKFIKDKNMPLKSVCIKINENGREFSCDILLENLIKKEAVVKITLGSEEIYYVNPYIFEAYDNLEYRHSKFNKLFKTTRWAKYNYEISHQTSQTVNSI